MIWGRWILLGHQRHDRFGAAAGADQAEGVAEDGFVILAPHLARW